MSHRLRIACRAYLYSDHSNPSGTRRGVVALRNRLANLRVRFLLLAIVAVLPALGLLTYSASEQRDEAIASASADTSRIARLAVSDQARLLESARQMLVLLSQMPEVGLQSESCNSLLFDLRVTFPIYANLGVIASDGDLVCSAVDPPEPINLGDLPEFQTVMETNAYDIGAYRIDPVTAKPVLLCSFPVPGQTGETIGVVFAAIDLTVFSQLTSVANLDPEAILTVYDRNGTVLARRPDPDNLTGAPLAGTPVVDVMLQQHSGVSEETLDDRDYVFAFASVTGAIAGDLSVSIAIPKSSVLEVANVAYSRDLTRLGFVLLVSLIAAWVGGDLLGRRSSDEHKVLVRRVYDAFSTGDVDTLDEIVDPDFIDHDPMPGQQPGVEGLKQAVGSFRLTFPDGEIVVEELVAESNRVAARVTLRGTQWLARENQPPLPDEVAIEGIEIFRIEKDKIIEGWSRFVFPAAEMRGSSFNGERVPDLSQLITSFDDAIAASAAERSSRLRSATGPIRWLARRFRS